MGCGPKTGGVRGVLGGLKISLFVPVSFAFVVLGLVSAVLRQEIGWEERLRNDLFCVDWDVKPDQSTEVLFRTVGGR